MASLPDAALLDECVTKVEMFLHARELPNMDILSNTDAFCVVYQKAAHNTPGGAGSNGQWVEIARTEVIDDTQNPDWTTQVLLDYHFEEIQSMLIRVYDEDRKGVRDLGAHDFVGEAEFRLGALMGSVGTSLSCPLRGGANTGRVVIHAEEVASDADFVELEFSGRKLANKDGFFGKSDPFLTVSRLRENGTWTRVWQSEVVMNNLSPNWRRATIPVQVLCNGDYDRPLRFEVYDWDSDGSHDYMGMFESSLRGIGAEPETSGPKAPDTSGLLNFAAMASVRGGGIRSGTTEFPVIEEKKKAKKRSYKNSGYITVRRCKVIRRFTFSDYLVGGCDISLIVAVDYTASNGNPSMPNSLHYVHPTGRLNMYEEAIMSVGSVLEDYDSDKQFPVYGFGARVNRQLSHCFPLTFDESRPEVQGVRGIVECYRHTFGTGAIKLSGPTLFTPVLRKAAEAASRHSSQERQHYSVLLILTDGAIQDVQNTIDTICACADLPLSIVIVGLGEGPQHDFGTMNVLDGDGPGGRLRSTAGRLAARDIVQFVPYRDFKHSPSRLAQEVLAEIPSQLVSYFASKGVEPNPPLPTPSFDTAPFPAAAPTAPPPPPAAAAARGTDEELAAVGAALVRSLSMQDAIAASAAGGTAPGGLLSFANANVASDANGWNGLQQQPFGGGGGGAPPPYAP